MTKTKRWQSWGYAGLVVVCLAALGAAWPASSAAAVPPARPQPGEAAGFAADIAGATTVYLPAILKNTPLNNIFGATVLTINNAGGFDKLAATESVWTRGPFLPWDAIEATPGVYNWAAANWLDVQAQRAASDGVTLIMGVSRTPAWARHSGYSLTHPCAPMSPSAIDDFANFMRAAVERYSQPPFNIRYWEIWNEPDIAPESLPDAQSPFGCWGDPDDPYFGGGYYAQMLAQVYPAIKQADPNAQVLVGGLLLDCDPDNPPANKPYNCAPARFLEGILQAGGGAYFDGISFHAYDYMWPDAIGYSNPNWYAAHDTTGPVTIVKANFLRSVLAAYNVQGKYLLNTESAILSLSETCNSACQPRKAHYVTMAYAQALAIGLKANVWYSVHGWRGSELLTGANAELPAFDAYEYAAAKLSAAVYRREVTEFANVMGYEFSGPDGVFWVVWSKDGATHNLTLPGTPAAVTNHTGGSVSAGNPLPVGLEPRYIFWP